MNVLSPSLLCSDTPFVYCNARERPRGGAAWRGRGREVVWFTVPLSVFMITYVRSFSFINLLSNLAHRYENMAFVLKGNRLKGLQGSSFFFVVCCMCRVNGIALNAKAFLWIKPSHPLFKLGFMSSVKRNHCWVSHKMHQDRLDVCIINWSLRKPEGNGCSFSCNGRKTVVSDPPPPTWSRTQPPQWQDHAFLMVILICLLCN